MNQKLRIFNLQCRARAPIIFVKYDVTFDQIFSFYCDTIDQSMKSCFNLFSRFIIIFANKFNVRLYGSRMSNAKNVK